MIKNIPAIEFQKTKHGLVDLTNLEKSKEKGPKGTNASDWYHFKDGRVLFKKYDNDLQAFGEVLYSKVALRNNVPVPKYELAMRDTKDGVERGTISYDLVYQYANEDESSKEKSMDKKLVGIEANNAIVLFSRYLNDIPNFIKKRTDDFNLVRLFNKKHNNYHSFLQLFNKRYPNDVEKLKVQFIKEAIFDVLFDNVDNNLWNTMFVDRNGKNPNLYEIDFGNVACLHRGEKVIENNLKDIEAGNSNIEDYLAGGIYQYKVDVKPDEIDNPYNPWLDLIDFYRLSSDEDREFIYNFINQISLDQDLKEINKTMKVSDNIIKWINLVFNSRKFTLLEKMENISKDNSASIEDIENDSRNIRRKENKERKKDALRKNR